MHISYWVEQAEYGSMGTHWTNITLGCGQIDKNSIGTHTGPTSHLVEVEDRCMGHSLDQYHTGLS